MTRPALTVGDFRDRARLARLTRIDADRTFGPRDIAEVLGEGWHVVDGWGCWAARRTATLRFAVTAPANTAMELQFSCVLPRGILQRLDIRTGETRFRQWYRLSLRDITQPTIVLRGPFRPRGCHRGAFRPRGSAGPAREALATRGGSASACTAFRLAHSARRGGVPDLKA